MPEHLSSHHRDTLRKIFSHSSSANIEWREVLSLLRAVGTVQERHNGKLDVTIGPETEVLTPPHGKDVGEPMLVDLRRMLTEAGLAPDDAPAVDDQRSRDHGDSRWGEPA
ncbi:MAG TPA: hypothetical protein VMB51_13135 [Solirubrobacteraceae bacterium]|nr:hypothetical protein [Solirubrobacteraceae bacterium]